MPKSMHPAHKLPYTMNCGDYSFGEVTAVEFNPETNTVLLKCKYGYIEMQCDLVVRKGK